MIRGEMVDTFPDYIIAGGILSLALASVVFALLSIHHRHKSRLLDQVIDRYNLVHKALDDFVLLAITSLPLAAGNIVASIDRVTSARLSSSTTATINELAKQLYRFSTILTGENTNSAIRSDSEDQILFGTKPNPLGSLIVWSIIVPVLALIGLVNNFTTPHLSLAMQAAGLTTGSLILMASYRRYGQARSLRQVTEKQASLKVYLLGVRREFIADTGQKLEDFHNQLMTDSQPLTNIPQAREFFYGLRLMAKITKGIVSAHRATDMDTSAPLLSVTTVLNKRINEVYRPGAEDHQMKLESNIEDGLAFRIQPKDLEQLMNILVENAITYSKVGSRITIRGHRRGSKVMISVTDTGQGMDKEMLDFLFRPMQKTRIAGQDYQPNKVSLGLQVCKVILTRIGGELRVSTKPGKGTTAIIIAPRKRTDIPLKIPRHVGASSGQLN